MARYGSNINVIPRKVLSVQYCYVRCVTGCEDGKIRVWSLVSGDCIKVIRANAKGDSITALFVDLDRSVGRFLGH